MSFKIVCSETVDGHLELPEKKSVTDKKAKVLLKSVRGGEEMGRLSKYKVKKK